MLDLKALLTKILQYLYTSGSIVGEIKTYAGATVPNGWLECDGSEVAIADYPLLYDAIQNLWGTPSDSDHFILPNMKGKVPVGQDTSATPDADFDTVGETGGDKSVTLTANQSGVKSHGHGFYADFYIRHGKDSGTTWVASGSNTAYAQGAYGSQWAGGGSITSYKHHPDRIAINGGVGAATAQNAAEAHTNMQPYAVVKYIICTGE